VDTVRLVLAGVAVAAAFVVAAPAQAALPAAPAQPVQQTLGGATSAAGAATSTAATAASAVQRQATKGIAAAKQAAPPVAAPPATRLPRVTVPHVAVPRVTAPRVAPQAAPRVTLPAPPSPVDTSAVQRVGRETRAYREKLVQPLADAPRRLAAVDEVVALLGNTLRSIAPRVGALLAPVEPLLGDLRGIGRFDFPALVAVVSPGKAQTLRAGHGVLAAPPTRGVPPAALTASAPAQTSQAPSAKPPAAEVGGRPVSSPPRTAPTPVAGGATALFASGGIFVPFLGLLVLAALAAPRLMRRLDELPAFVRPAPFLCALERPG
jgi:hypothetical protein